MTRFPLHVAAESGDLDALERALVAAGDRLATEIDAYDQRGQTALMRALASPAAGGVVVRRLIDAGASIHKATGEGAYPQSLLNIALGAGNLAKLKVLVEAGADLRYVDKGYTALLHGVHGRDVTSDPGLLELIRYLVDRGVDVNAETQYRETALRVLSRLGRFDAVKLLLSFGADEAQLAWNPLLRAVAFGEREEAQRLLSQGADPDARDWWKRNAWHLAVVAGDVGIASTLRAAGVDVEAPGGRNGQPALFYALQGRDAKMVEWLLENGANANSTDASGETALNAATDNSFDEGVEILLRAGADVNAKTGIYTALGGTSSPVIARRLLAGGADPADLTYEARRALVGLQPDPSDYLLDLSAQQFERGAARRWGSANPERMIEPFWEAMIRAGVNAWAAAQNYPGATFRSPVWCAQRFGQSITFLEDGRVIQIAGEHEDSYDPDFCIYNDVFVHDGEAVTIYGYPEREFRPRTSIPPRSSAAKSC